MDIFRPYHMGLIMDKRIVDFCVMWTDEQYFPGHNAALPKYTHYAIGVGKTLHEAFENALDRLSEQEPFRSNSVQQPSDFYQQMQEALAQQVKDPSMLDKRADYYVMIEVKIVSNY